jgi:hypothetical protein
MQYATTPAFLEYFGLSSLSALPAADELRRIPVVRPESLLTVDPGLATAPSEQLALPTATDAPAPETNEPAAVPVANQEATSEAAPSAETPPAIS